MQRTACGPSTTTNMTHDTKSTVGANGIKVDLVACDFLIVGAGTSGCVLASRLVRQGLKVLLVEGGPADSKKFLRTPKEWFGAASSGDTLSEAFMTVPQKGLNNRRVPAYRGRGGGGSSNVNGMLYSRGSKENYETDWPWELEDIEASFKSVEIELNLEECRSPGSIGPSYERMLEEIGFKYPEAVETSGTDNGPKTNLQNGDDEAEATWTTLGLQPRWKRTTAGGGTKRRTAWEAFVNPVMTMPNLDICDDAFVSRVIIEGGRAVGVELMKRGWGGRMGGGRVTRQLRFTPGSSAEIVLCGGVFRTPKLLMLSGVGPKEHLEEKGVPVVVDSPHVGSNLQDHLLLPCVHITKKPTPDAECASDSIHGHIYFSCPPEKPLSAGETSDNAAAAAAAATVATVTDDSVERSLFPVQGLMFWDGATLEINMPSLINAVLQKPGLFMVLLRLVMCSIAWFLVRLTPLGPMVRRRLRGATMLLTTVKSKGTVRLRSKDAQTPPDIDPAYLSHPDDERALCHLWHVLRCATRHTDEGKAALGMEINPGSGYNNGNDDESFLRFARDNAVSFFHPVGTCMMGEGLRDSVVSSATLRVHGVSGLRVADTSVTPHIPHTPTQAMAMMIGDRAAAIALKDRFTKERMQANMVDVAGQSVN